MELSTNKRTIGRLYDEVLNEGRLEVLDEIALADHHEHDPFPGQGDGVEGLKQRVSMVRGAIDPHFTIDHLLEDGDKIAVVWTNHGTHLGNFLGIPPTGKTFTVRGVDILRLQDGRLAEHWDVVDRLEMLMQIGVVPPLGQSGLAGSRSADPSPSNRDVAGPAVPGR